eukprot:TRINITY_DN26243_c0_g1_i1.p1 TRINITY_DN26243_c0_g1~~TRINITY_DN26243_c0_g1_i1.p1  ORF type:complete len:265 (+),score=74.84 TRINITY_DN26243_c0_g1_i1:511-1305(+)
MACQTACTFLTAADASDACGGVLGDMAVETIQDLQVLPEFLSYVVVRCEVVPKCKRKENLTPKKADKKVAILERLMDARQKALASLGAEHPGHKIIESDVEAPSACAVAVYSCLLKAFKEAADKANSAASAGALKTDELYAQSPLPAKELLAVCNSKDAKALKDMWPELQELRGKTLTVEKKLSASFGDALNKAGEELDATGGETMFQSVCDKVCECVAIQAAFRDAKDKGGSRPAAIESAEGIVSQLGGTLPPPLSLLLQSLK